MQRTRENSDVFNSLDEIYLVFTSKKKSKYPVYVNSKAIDHNYISCSCIYIDSIVIITLAKLKSK